MSRFGSFWRGISDSLSGRMALFLAIALLPLGIVAFMQTSAALNESQKRSEAALTGEVLRAASGELLLIQQAQGTARTLASLPTAILRDAGACSTLMRRILALSPNFSHVGFINADGVMNCSSTGKIMDYSASPAFADRFAANDFAFSVIRDGKLSKTSVVSVSFPVFDENGLKIGLTTVSVPHKRLDLASDSGPASTNLGLRYVTFDSEGEILTSAEKLATEEAYLPRGRDLADIAKQPGAFTTRSRGGPLRTYAVVALVPKQVYALASWPTTAAAQPGFLSGVPPLVFPALMWLASLFVGMFAAELQVTRYVRDLRQSMKAFASGSRKVTEHDFSRAPRELREVGDAFASMTDTIMHREARMEDMLHQKEVLLREVHHRVKNNLQLIASIMNMQMRQSLSAETKALMKNLHNRVMSLATIHQGLYQTSGLTEISADELLSGIISQLMRMGAGPERRFDVRIQLDGLRLVPDQAVPLALLLTEVVTNALKYATADPGNALWLRVALTRSGPADAILSVENSMAAPGAAVAPSPDTAPGGPDGLGEKLTRAFAQQLGGRLEISRLPDRYSVVVAFGVRRPDEAGADGPDVEPDLSDEQP